MKKKGILSTLGLHDRAPLTRSATPASSSSGHNRNRSSDSQQHNDRDQRIYEVQERRKRDKILRTVGGRRGQGMGSFAARPDDTGEAALKPDGTSGQLRAGEVMPEGTSVRGDENAVEEGDEGQYVNLAVDFSYDGRKNRKGYDLHFLIYMGMGVKGLGGVEVPIWVTMLKITGTVSPLRGTNAEIQVWLNAFLPGPYQVVAQSRRPFRAECNDINAQYSGIRFFCQAN